LSAADIKKRAQNLHLHRPVAEDRPGGANRRTKGLKSSGRHNRDVHNFIFFALIKRRNLPLKITAIHQLTTERDGESK
jgi:hypothetical protein